MEPRDKNNVEEFSLVLRFVKAAEPKEHLVQMATLDQLRAEYIANKIIQELESLGLNVNRIISQCYDGANVMSGTRASVQTLLQENLKEHIPYIHCFNHRLHLVVIHALEHEDAVRQFFELLATLYNFTRRPVIAQMYEGENLSVCLISVGQGIIKRCKPLSVTFLI